MKQISRILCLIMVFVLIFSMIPLAYVQATELTPAEETAAEATDPIETVSETTVPAASDKTETTEPETTQETDVIPSSDISLLSASETYQNGKYRQRAVIWTTNGESVNYTYNGTSHDIDQIIMHTVWYEDAFEIAYCIEPGAYVINSSDYDEVEHSGVSAWGKLDYAKQRGVSLALLYGYPNSIDSDDIKTQFAYQLATYMIVHEIILGWREDVHPFSRTNDAYFDVFGGGTADSPEYLQITSEYYSEVHEQYLLREDIAYAYDYISSKLAKHDLIPYFTSISKEQAPTYTMEKNDDGTYSISLHDWNGILLDYDFTDTSNLTFTTSFVGFTMTATASNSKMGLTTVAPTRTLPSVENSAFLIWNAETGSQELCTVKALAEDPVPAYFNLQLPTGKLSITKRTSDGNNRAGWQFNIYSNEACTKMVSGPHYTTSGGTVLITGLDEGTYWVKEMGNRSASVEELYTCTSKNPQQVTISTGKTTSVTFVNSSGTESPCTLYIIKTTDTGEDTAGWQFGIYSDRTCESLMYGPYTTNAAGRITMTDLLPGTYWIKEIGHTDEEINAKYTCNTTNPQKIVAQSGLSNRVLFQNILSTVELTVYKTDPYEQPLPDAHFLLEYSDSGDDWNPVVYSSTSGYGNCSSEGLTDGILSTDDSGYLTFIGLYPGLYYRLTEVQAPNGYQLLGKAAFQGTINAEDEAVTVHVVNSPVFTLPHTGSWSMLGMTAVLAACLMTCAGAIFWLRKKEI